MGEPLAGRIKGGRRDRRVDCPNLLFSSAPATLVALHPPPLVHPQALSIKKGNPSWPPKSHARANMTHPKRMLYWACCTLQLLLFITRGTLESLEIFHNMFQGHHRQIVELRHHFHRRRHRRSGRERHLEGRAQELPARLAENARRADRVPGLPSTDDERIEGWRAELEERRELYGLSVLVSHMTPARVFPLIPRFLPPPSAFSRGYLVSYVFYDFFLLFLLFLFSYLAIALSQKHFRSLVCE